MNQKKISLLGCLGLGIGGIVGAGIFGTLPEVTAQIGPGIIYALLGAVVVIVFRSVTRMYTIAALPSNASAFMHASKLMHPIVGALSTINAFLQCTMVSLFGVLFSMYFGDLFPGVELSSTVSSVGILIIFMCISWFGNKTSVRIGNIMVVVLLSAMVLYIVLGFPNLDAENITFVEIVKPGVGISTIAASAGVLTSSLSGAAFCAELADEMETPERNVPLSIILCPVIVAVLYALMAVVTLGVIPYAEVSTLAQVAGCFMAPALLKFFVVAGPICGIITSLVPMALACVASMDFSARNKILPEIFGKKNKHDIAWFSLIITYVISIVICASGATFGVIMTIFSFTNTVVEMPNAVAPIFALKKYPKTCENSFVKFSPGVVKILSVITLLILIYLAVEMARTLDAAAVIGILAVYVIGYVYVLLRRNYLKKTENLDLFEVMSAPYAPWEEKEASYK